jgi:RHS repeat-associated protein
MNTRRLARIAFAILITLLFHAHKALATTVPAYDQCIYALDKTAANALYINGAAIINATGCGVVVDSSSSTALKFSGSGSFTAKYFDVVGGYSTSGAVTFSPTPQTDSAYQPDPLTFLVPPSSTACNYTNFKATTGSSTLNPGTYCNGITISGATNVTFNPGTYILMGGGLNVTGAAILNGTGLTFFLTQGLGYQYGPLSITGSVVATLKAPASGPYTGILFYQDPRIGTGQPANTSTGSSASTLDGALYFPTTALTFAGASSGGSCLIIVADTITLTGSATLKNTCTGGSPLQPPVSVSIAPTAAALYPGQTQQFTATVANTSNTAVTWTLNPATGAGTISAAGLYTAPATISAPQTVTVTATSQADITKSAAATVTLSPPPVLSAAAPSSGLQGQSGISVAITGQYTHFGATSAVTFGNTGVTATGITVTDATHLTATVGITATAAVGATSVTVTTGTEVATGANLFTVTAGTPVVGTVAPNSGQQGQTGISVAITGQYTHFVAGTTAVTFGNPGVTAAVAVTDATHLTATVTVSATAAVGATSVTVATGSESETLANGFTVTAGTPAVGTVAPNSGQQGQSGISVAITGQYTHFVAGTTAVTFGNPGVTAAVAVTDATHLTATVAVSATAAVGATSVTVTTGSESETLANGFTVTAGNVYAHRRSIAIDHTKVPNTDQANFPVLISGVYPFLASTTVPGGQVQNANGYDIIFTSDYAGTMKLDHEIESYDSNTGTINMWVRIPLLSHTCDTIIYVVYGNGAITSSQENRTGVWDGNYQGVWHLTTMADSSANGFTLTDNNAAGTVPGQIASAVGFNGSSQYLSNPSMTIPTGSPITISYWEYQASANVQNSSAFNVGGSDTPNRIQANSPWSDKGLYWDYGDLNNGGRISTDYTPYLDAWTYVTLQYDPAAKAHSIYLNGLLKAVGISSNAPVTAQNGIQLGQFLGYYLKASLDELRVSTVARSADWIATEFANQNSPGTFYSVSAENAIGVKVCPGAVVMSGGQTQQFTATVTNTANQSVTWSSTPAGAGSVGPNSGLYTAPAAIAAPQQVAVTATAVADTTASAPAQVSLLPPSSFAALRINSGGPTYVDPAGRVWLADSGFSPTCNGGYGGPNGFVPPAGLDGEYATALDCNTIGYQITVPNMDYLVTLKFAEPNASYGPGRVFSVAVNGETNSVLRRVDVVVNAGGSQKAWDTSIPISVTNNQINIAITGLTQYYGAFISAIEIVPAGTIEVLPETATLAERQSLQFTAIEPGVSSPSLNWSIVPANLGSIDPNTGLYTAPASIASVTTVTVTAADAANPNTRGTAVVTLSPTDPTSFPALRINSGGPTYVDPAGRVWLADSGFSPTCNGGYGGPNGFVPPAGLDGEYATALDCNTIGYQITVPNMDYLVTLKFAEPNASYGPGRVFSVAVNGETNSVLRRVDVVVNAGGSQKAWDTSIPISVTNNQINIAITGLTQYYGAFISAIEIVPAGTIEVLPETATLAERQSLQFTAIEPGVSSPSLNWSIVPANLGSIDPNTGLYTAPASIASTTTVTVTAVDTSNSTTRGTRGTAVVTLSPTDPTSFPALRINSGGPTYVDPLGRVWVADEYFATSCANNGSPNAFVAPAGLDLEYADGLDCRDANNSSITYQILQVPNMDYLVTLKFAEPNVGWGPGTRIFSVAVNGETNSVLERVDVAANAGTWQKAWDTSIPISVTNNTINIVLTGILRGAIISAIEIVPANSIEVLPETATLAERQSLQFTAIEPGVKNPVLNWSITPAGLGSIDPNSGLYTAPSSIASAANVTVTAADANNSSIRGTAVVSLSPVDPNSFQALRINSGGPTYVDPAGRVWVADTDFTPCNPDNQAPAFVPPPGLDGEYADARSCWNNNPQMSYQFPVPNMDYLVTLKFAEPNANWGPGSRIFSVAVNGQTNSALQRVDVAANAGGPRKAWDTTIPVSVTNNFITIVFSGISGGAPIINAIEIVPAGSIEVVPGIVTLGLTQDLRFSALAHGLSNSAVTWSIGPSSLGTIDPTTGLYVAPASLPANTSVTVIATSVANPNVFGTATVNLSTADPNSFQAVRINSGGPTYVDPAGRVWVADTDFTPCNPDNQAPPFVDPEGLDAEYADARSCWNNNPQMSYQIPVPNMDYLVTLKFAEPNANWGPGSRIFSVTVNGQTNSALQRVDVAANAGGSQKAWDTTIPVSVNNNSINIAFSSISGGAPIINAIEIIPPGTVHATPPAAVLYASQTQQFTATVDDPANPGVVWTITPPNAGSISSTGLYLAPPVVTTQQTVTVTATNHLNSKMTATATVALMPPISVAVAPAARTMSAGQIQEFTALVTNAPIPAVTWSINPSIGTLTGAGIYTAPATIPSQQTVIVTATSQADPSKSGAATLILSPTPVVSQLTLVPPVAGPNVTGASQTLGATLTTRTGQPVSGVTISFSVTGQNPASGTAVTSATGSAVFTYTGQNSGTDVVQASTGAMVSNAAGITWLTPVQPISTSAVYGRFFYSDTSGVFKTPPTATPVFTQWFPTINFNPPVGAVPGNTSDVNTLTVPFTDLTTDVNGFYTGTIVAQGNGYQAGVAPLGPFQAVFTGSYVVAGPGDVTFTSFNDDGFIMGIGCGATRVSGELVNAPSVTPFEQYPVMGAFNEGTLAVGYQFIVHFPAAGSYPYEVDYTDNGPSWMNWLSLTMASGPVQTAVPPAGSLTVTPNPVPPMLAGQNLTLTAQATDATGNPAPNATVTWYVMGPNTLEANSVTDASGKASFTYTGASVGTDTVQAQGTITGMFTVSNQVTVPWGVPAPTPPTNPPSGLNITVSGATVLTLPDNSIYTATATDPGLPAGGTIAIAWSQVSGPATVTFSAPQQAVTTVTFPAPGAYTLLVTATDSSSGTKTLQVGPIMVNPPVAIELASGWIGSPANHASVTGLIPITVAAGETLTGGTLTYYPIANPDAVTVLSSSTTGGPGATLATLDTTLLADGSYYVILQATDSTGKNQASGVEIQVVGDYKPGRVTTSVTDLVVPAPGLPIRITRTYDSLTRATSSDFGNGWSLGINVQLDVSPQHDVTLTLNGQRRTFYFTPYQPGVYIDGMFIPNMLGVYFWSYTPEPGMYGTLTLGNDGSDMLGSTGCLFDWLQAYDNSYVCYDGIGTYNPTEYIYTDPYGRVYTIGGDGSLRSIQDLGGNTLTVTPTGIQASNGLNVPFTRDNLGRITQIIDTLGHQYNYAYDANGNLQSVTYPVDPLHPSDPANPSKVPVAQYNYDPTHLYTGGTDPRGFPLPSTTYDTSGRLQSVTLTADGSTTYKTSYAYDTADPVTVTYPDSSTAAGYTTTITNPDLSVTTQIYDSYGMLLSTTDPLTHTTIDKYDANHNLIAVTDPLGHTTSYTYDSNGNRTSVTYPATATTKNTTSQTAYNAYSEPIATTDELGNVRTFSYDSNFWPQLATDKPGGPTDTLHPVVSFTFNANGTMAAKAVGYDLTQTPGAATTYVYDTYGNLQRQTDPLGAVTAYTYDNLGRKTSMTPPAPAAPTTYTYDALGHLSSVTVTSNDPNTPSRLTHYAYDPNGNKTSETDPNGNVTAYAYDQLNRLKTVTYPTTPPSSTSYTYDYRNNVTGTTDQAGHVTQNVYDTAGRLTSVTTTADVPADARTTSYTYYADGRKASETDPRGNLTNYAYDQAGRLTSVTASAGTPNQSLTSYVYDDAGNQTGVTDANLHTTQSQYDARRRLTLTTYDDKTTTQYAYDGPGNLTLVTDQAGNQVQYTYDLNNQLRSVVQLNHPNPAHNTTAYGYDSNGNLTALTDANTHMTQNGFDPLNQLNQETMPAGQMQTRTYDAAGNLKSLTDYNAYATTDPNGHTTTYTYDTLNRLTQRTPGQALLRSATNPAGDVAESFTYTATGKRATMTDASGTTTYGYDDHDRLATKATPQGTLSYTYDPAGNVATMQSSNANGVSVAYTYDSLNRLATVVDNRLPAGANTTTYTYDPASNLATVTYPNGLQSTFQYDDLNRVTGLNNGKASYAYTLGPTGNRQSAAESSGRTLNWSYDGIYRLTNETISLDPMSKNGTVAYTLDPVGNRLSQASSIPGIPTASFLYDFDDRIQPPTESYDPNGNTLVSGSRTFAYDFENRLKSMNGGAVTLVYDGDGNRVAKTAGGVTTRYLVDDLNPTGYAQVVEEIGAGGVQRTYTYGLRRINQNQLANSTWTPSFYGYDALGSVRQLTSSTGAVTDTYDFDAWGNAVNTTGSTPNAYLYRGEQFDPDLNLYYLRARYLSPLTGRLLTRDPAAGRIKVPATLHKYLYAGADPVNFEDPSGEGRIERALVTLVITVGLLVEEPEAALPHIELEGLEAIWDFASKVLVAAITGPKK